MTPPFRSKVALSWVCLCGAQRPDRARASPAAMPQQKLQNLLRRLHAGELSGRRHAPTGLLSLPTSICARIDHENVRESLYVTGMGTLLYQLASMISDRKVDAGSFELKLLINNISERVCDSKQQRSIFLVCHGDVLFQQLLQQLVLPREGVNKAHAAVINECVGVLVRRVLFVSSPAAPIIACQPCETLSIVLVAVTALVSNGQTS